MPEKGNVTIVTGAATGMGAALVKRLATRECPVVAVDVKGDALDWMKDYPTVVPHVADLTTEEGNLGMVQAARDRFGGLDAVVLNAAISVAGDILEMPMESYDRMFAINTRGVALGLRASIPALRARGGGAIVVTASMNAMRGTAHMWAYDASKGAVMRMAQSAALAVAHQGIRVNAVLPGATRGTGMTARSEIDAPERYERMRQGIPMRRWAEADEIAAVMEFLISPAASYVTGAAIPVDGGVLVSLGLQGLPQD